MLKMIIKFDEDKVRSESTILAGCEWITYAKDWLWYEDTEEAEDLIQTFEVR